MTAMTTASPEADWERVDDVTPPTTTTNRERGKAWFKKLKSPKGLCFLSVASAVLLIVAAYLLSKVVFGILYIESCDADHFIPIYLVISGALPLIVIALIILLIYLKYKQDNSDEGVSSVHLTAFVYFFIHLVLQLAGSVCVIRTRNHLNSKGSVDCDETLVTFSFGVVIFELVISCLMFIIAVLSICELVYLECCQTQDPNRDRTTSNVLSVL
ncbi:uncharacterized protein LOC131954407 isoform X2 [Physella acuta]|uniref:uncharacterized protein LOC131954407 isoform X2 n=1 Tax=Physella acuta TaxID=109671 RepID=UPI0027DB22A6|nr:uncharacterized protein LOC131954407 isoform X2 [Physella acuta]